MGTARRGCGVPRLPGTGRARVETEDRRMADLTIYTTTWCGYCVRLKQQMQRAGIAFTEVDIEADPQAADLVASLNGGNQTVPTLVFPDGSAATNPSLREVQERLAG
jgi:mycoredoxin